jgi:hypothetical protein
MTSTDAVLVTLPAVSVQVIPLGAEFSCSG